MHAVPVGAAGEKFLKFDTFSWTFKANKSGGKKILNTTFYPDQKGINKFIKGKSELKGNKQV